MIDDSRLSLPEQVSNPGAADKVHFTQHASAQQWYDWTVVFDGLVASEANLRCVRFMLQALLKIATAFGAESPMRPCRSHTDNQSLLVCTHKRMCSANLICSPACRCCSCYGSRHPVQLADLPRLAGSLLAGRLAAGDVQGAAYWAYHLLKGTFFLVLVSIISTLPGSLIE